MSRTAARSRSTGLARKQRPVGPSRRSAARSADGGRGGAPRKQEGRISAHAALCSRSAQWNSASGAQKWNCSIIQPTSGTIGSASSQTLAYVLSFSAGCRNRPRCRRFLKARTIWRLRTNHIDAARRAHLAQVAQRKRVRSGAPWRSPVAMNRAAVAGHIARKRVSAETERERVAAGTHRRTGSAAPCSALRHRQGCAPAWSHSSPAQTNPCSTSTRSPSRSASCCGWRTRSEHTAPARSAALPGCCRRADPPRAPRPAA